MKRVKSILTAAIFVLSLTLISTSSYAQGPQGRGGRGGQQGAQKEQLTPEQRVEKQLANMTKNLSLTPEQVIKMEALLTEQAKATTAKKEAKKEAKKQTQKEKREAKKQAQEELKKKQEEQNSAMKAILTKDQYIKYLESKKSRAGAQGQGGQRPQRGGGRQGGGPANFGGDWEM